MKFRIMLAMTFDDTEHARSVWAAIKAAWEQTSQGEDDSASLHRCYHDEDPTHECEIIEEL